MRPKSLRQVVALYLKLPKFLLIKSIAPSLISVYFVSNVVEALVSPAATPATFGYVIVGALSGPRLIIVIISSTKPSIAVAAATEPPSPKN